MIMQVIPKNPMKTLVLWGKRQNCWTIIPFLPHGQVNIRLGSQTFQLEMWQILQDQAS